MNNNNFKKAFDKIGRRWIGIYKGYRITIFKMYHGGYCAQVWGGRDKKEIIAQDGFHTRSLPTLAHAKQYAKFHVMPSCKTRYLN